MASANEALAQDFQLVPVGQGAPDGVCVRPGPNNTLESTPAADDRIFGSNILSGPNGICETPLAGDDERPAGVTLGGGTPFADIIIAGPVNQNNGICDSPVTAAGDDNVLVSPGNSTPRRVAIRRGANATVESTPAGDDVITTIICPGADFVLDSTPAGDDIVVINDKRCTDVCAQTQACLVPGADDVLQTTPDPNDDPRNYVSTGANGIAETTAAGDDVQLITVGNGTLNAGCVDAGADGIAQTSLCGNGATDVDEDCDDAGESASCDADCTFAVCGDSTVNTAAGEQCDPPNATTCKADCTINLCGNGTVDAGEDCDEGGNTATCDADCTTPACGDGFLNPAAGELCDDGNTAGNDGCDPTCAIEFCGDGIIQSGIGEECDDGGANSDTTPDACRTNCALPSCGDGVVDPSNTEECDDGNNKNNDDCVVALGCKTAVCGDGFRHTKGSPPFEECDDGNTANGDGCSSTCVAEPSPGCGNGVVETLCTAGTVGASCATNADCDVSGGDGVCTTEECDDGNNSNKDDCLSSCVAATCGDGIQKTKGTPPFEQCDDGDTQPGDGCSAVCEIECGNGVIDGSCSQGDVGAFCQTNADCDLTPGDGVCVTEECDIGIDGLCTGAPIACSNDCTIAACGNGIVECTEQCDLGVSNGVPGSGCTALCERNLIGGREVSNKRECPGAWTLDSPPNDPRRRRQRCQDGTACDFDGTANGSCTFSVGYCVNRPDPAGCAQAPVIAIDLRKLRTEDPVQANAAEILTDALAALTSGGFDAPSRCREGLRGKNCTENTDCDSFLGAGDGLCDVATGVSYDPPLAASGPNANQTTACTPGQLIAVPTTIRSLRLRTQVRRVEPFKGDRDTLRLSCLP